MKCVNCDNHAIYTVADAGVNPVDYCTQCLPKHLRERATAGHFPLAFTSAKEPTKKSSKKKTEDTAVEEVTEEPTE